LATSYSRGTLDDSNLSFQLDIIFVFFHQTKAFFKNWLYVFLD
jgi:hypothetical protein